MNKTQKKQAMSALRKGNRIRIKGAALRQRLAREEITLAKALDHRDAQRLKVAWLLQAMDGWGPARVHKLLGVRLDMEKAENGGRVAALNQKEKKLIVKGVKDPSFWLVP